MLHTSKLTWLLHGLKMKKFHELETNSLNLHVKKHFFLESYYFREPNHMEFCHQHLLHWYLRYAPPKELQYLCSLWKFTIKKNYLDLFFFFKSIMKVLCIVNILRKAWKNKIKLKINQCFSRPLYEAKCSGVSPLKLEFHNVALLALTSAPWSINNLTKFVWPFLKIIKNKHSWNTWNVNKMPHQIIPYITASWIGVSPWLSALFTSAPFSINIFAISSCPFSANVNEIKMIRYIYVILLKLD